MNFKIDGDIDSNTAKEFLLRTSNIPDGERLDIVISSEGGSVIDGNVIVSRIRELSKTGHKTTAHVVSVAASMASVIACACDNLILDSNSFLMVHQVWTTVAGNADDLRKEANTLDLFTKSLISVYRTKFDKTDDEIMALLKDETWILGEQASKYGLKCIINYVGEDLDIAAKLMDFKEKFNRVIKSIESDNTMEKEEIKEETEDVKEETSQEETPVEQEEVVEQPVEEEKKKEDDPMADEEFLETEEEEEEPTREELENTIEELKKTIEELTKKLEEAEKPVEDRISGIQSAMQKNFNAKINDFTNELQAKNQELTMVKDQVISLEAKLADCEKNCEDLASALRNKDSALESLNARVLSPAETPTKKTWRDLEGKEFFDYLKKNNNIIKITK